MCCGSKALGILPRIPRNAFVWVLSKQISCVLLICLLPHRCNISESEQTKYQIKSSRARQTRKEKESNFLPFISTSESRRSVYRCRGASRNVEPTRHISKLKDCSLKVLISICWNSILIQTAFMKVKLKTLVNCRALKSLRCLNDVVSACSNLGLASRWHDPDCNYRLISKDRRMTWEEDKRLTNLKIHCGDRRPLARKLNSPCLGAFQADVTGKWLSCHEHQRFLPFSSSATLLKLLHPSFPPFFAFNISRPKTKGRARKNELGYLTLRRQKGCCLKIFRFDMKNKFVYFHWIKYEHKASALYRLPPVKER